MEKEEQKENPFQFISDTLARQPLLKYALEVDNALSGIVNQGRSGSQDDVFFWNHPRESYISEALGQIQAPLMSLLKDCVSGLDVRAQQKPKEVFEFYEKANEIHLSLWRRKFTELLTDVKLFGEVSKQEVYLHYGLIQEYIKVFNIDRDLIEFFGSGSKHWKHSLSLIEAKIVEVENSLNIQDCWYLNEQKNWKDRTSNEKNGNRLLKSFRQRYKSAHSKFDVDELAITELTYAGYSRLSQDIHASFSPLKAEDSPPMNFDASINVISLFALMIYRNVAMALQIDESTPLVVKQIGLYLNNKKNEGSSIISSITYKPEIEMGDFVLINGLLAEVKAIELSKYNFRSFTVIFLSGSFVPSITEDSIPAYYVKLFQKKQAIKDGVLAEAAENGLELSEPLEDSKWDEYLRNSVIHIHGALLAAIANNIGQSSGT